MSCKFIFEKPSDRNMPLLLTSIYLISMAVMILEVTLTRLFSVVLYYHYVFIVVSFAILGLGMGAAYIFWLRPSSWHQTKLSCNLTTYSWLFAGTAILFVIYIGTFSFLRTLPFYSALAFPPFFFAGAILATCFGKFSAISSKIYFADLTGAATGAVVVVFLLEKIGGINTVVFLTVVSFIAGVLFSLNGQKLFKMLSFLYLGTSVILLILAVKSLFFQLIPPPHYHYTKTLFTQINNPQQKAKIVYTNWSALGRTDVVEDDNSLRKWIYIDGGAGTPMLRFDGNLRKLDYLKKDIGFFPYLWGETDEVLIIGPGGGIDVLFALIGGSNKVIGVEVNPGIVRVMHKFSKFNGGIYEDYDNVQIVVDEGRRFMRASNDKFDLLYLSLVYTQSAELKGYSFTENYVFTREAFGEYLAHLKPNGRLVIIFHDIYDLTKGFITALKALQESGVKNIQEASSHIIVINGSRNDTIFRPLLVVKKSPFTSQEIKKISKLALKLEFTPLFLPYWKRGEFYAIISKGEESLQGFISYTSARVAPATDNSPFFYQFDKGVPLELKVLLYPISFLLLSMIFWIVIWERKRIKENTRLGTFLAVYFSVLGIGYMLIEVSLIEKSLLFLGYPSLLLSVVLFSLLLSSGLGSLLSERLIGKEISKKIVLVPLGISVIIIFYIPLLSFLFDHFLTMSILLRSLIVMGVVFPVGFLMGIPFPVGLQILRRYSPQHIPIAYAVNGVASVVGSIVVLVIALLFGFTQALLLSAGVYLIAWLPLLYIVPDLSLS